MKPHKHAELIKAWADGATIEKKLGNYVKSNEPCWIVDDDPSWMTHVEYRIKPEPKPDVVRVVFMECKRAGFLVYDEGFNETPNLKLTFDGETGELKSAEVLK